MIAFYGVAGFFALFIAGCGSAVAADEAASAAGARQAQVAIDRATCPCHADLIGPLPSDSAGVPVLDSPTLGARAIDWLPNDKPIYRCGEKDGYWAIMFPAQGQPAVCCGNTSGSACPTGWLPKTAPIRLTG